MDNQFNNDLMNLQVRLTAELRKALPPTLEVVFDDLYFLILYQNLKPSTETGTAEARRILEKYRKMGI
jgi:hypothetical protein